MKKWYTFSPRMSQVIMLGNRTVLADCTHIRAVRDGSIMRATVRIGRDKIKVISKTQGKYWEAV